MEQHGHDTGEGSEGKNLKITLINEEDGEHYELKAGPGTPISTLIKEVYDKLNVERQSDDRLRCDGGASVFDFAEMHSRDYLAAGQCPKLVWVFVGGTGGAQC